MARKLYEFLAVTKVAARARPFGVQEPRPPCPVRGGGPASGAACPPEAGAPWEPPAFSLGFRSSPLKAGLGLQAFGSPTVPLILAVR